MVAGTKTIGLTTGSTLASRMAWVQGKLPLLAKMGVPWPGTREEAEKSGAGVGASKPATNADIQAGIKQHAGAAAANAATAAKGQGGAS